MLPDHYILHRANSDGRDTKYNLINAKPGVHEICSMETPYVYIETRRGYPSVLYGIYTSNFDSYGSEVTDMGGKCMNVTIQQ